MAKRKNTYPDWAEKFRAKGRTIRKVKNGYALYECTSEYVKGADYPKSKQKYLGMITEKEGFIPKKADAPDPVYLEYGLSRFIRLNFRRDVMRHVYDFKDELFWLGIIYYIFGSTDLLFLRSSKLTVGDADRLYVISNKVKTEKIARISGLINSCFESRIKDNTERAIVENLLRLCVVPSGPGARMPHIPDRVNEILAAHGLKFNNG